ncbi:ABC transporter ATP-binding protein [Georgenia sp. 311]|uniref:ABC transporter ATP-binding protein n=1 Tax=Georgenia wutianyii TaxID=2585135 RepID=A0ABX5VSI4_9MICO|nr:MULTISPECIES: ABC transporter ATP-binding protein [Georgenia]QDB79835.1 ABC transporter ATP-binding protein [Georgenia wutianyii]TNC18037.1 ABC transporter ATP-binding protein [Georgenia sp. 311]
MPEETVLSVRALSVGYDDEPVCAPIDLDLTPGEAVAVIGANGTGKSTFLRTVLGLQEPLAGRTRLLGAEPDPRDGDLRASVASVLGDDAFFPSLTVTEHLLLTALGHRVPDARDVVTDLLEEFGLTDRADALPAALSSGQRRRVLLAAAFVRPRSLLVLDEPEQRLDAGMRNRLAELLVEEREDGGAVLVASHDPVVVERVATSVVLLHDDGVRTLDPAAGAAAIAAL